MKNHFSIPFLCFCMLMASPCISGNAPDSAMQADKAVYAGRVKAAFLKAWKSYKDYAWGMDAVNPVSKKGHNWYAQSLLMTPVDAFSTMCIMGLTKEKAEAKQLIFEKLDFNKDFDHHQDAWRAAFVISTRR